MATALRIIDLDGKAIVVVKGKDQTWAEVIGKANLPKRFDFCLRHWQSDDPEETQTESVVKAYLDRVAYILIHDGQGQDIITDYKAIRDRVTLVGASQFVPLENLFYSINDHDESMNTSYPLPAIETKTERRIYESLTKPRRVPREISAMAEKRKRIDALHAAHPEACVTFVPVDTENRFRYDGKEWKIDDIPQYRPKHVHGDVQYDMDHVACAKCEGGMFWFDQDFRAISGHVHEVGA